MATGKALQSVVTPVSWRRFLVGSPAQPRGSLVTARSDWAREVKRKSMWERRNDARLVGLATEARYCWRSVNSAGCCEIKN